MSDTKKAIKAEAAAEKARLKASRSWYQKKRFIVPAALVVVAAAASSMSGEDASVPTATPAAEDVAEADDVAVDVEANTDDEDPEAPATAGLGEPVRDGKFEFTVAGLECGLTEVGPEFMSESAQGQFCLLNLRVENIGDQAQMLFADNQYLLNDAGTRYSASGTATLMHSDGNDTFFAEINPGNAVEGDIVFDVPADAEITIAELHDSAFSGGIQIRF